MYFVRACVCVQYPRNDKKKTKKFLFPFKHNYVENEKKRQWSFMYLGDTQITCVSIFDYIETDFHMIFSLCMFIILRFLLTKSKYYDIFYLFFSSCRQTRELNWSTSQAQVHHFEIYKDNKSKHAHWYRNWSIQFKWQAINWEQQYTIQYNTNREATKKWLKSELSVIGKKWSNERYIKNLLHAKNTYIYKE